MVINDVSQVAVNNPTTGISGGGQAQPAEANGSVERSGGPAQVRAANVSVLPGRAGQSSGVTDREVGEIVEELNDFAQKTERQLLFSVDEDSGSTVIKVIDSKTDEIVRQIPPDEILTLRERLGEIQGMLFKTEA